MGAYWNPAERNTFVLCECGVCQRQTLFEIDTDPLYRDPREYLQPDWSNDPFSDGMDQLWGRKGISEIKVKATYPPAPDFDAPSYTPENVKKAFVDGLRAYDAGLYPSAAERVRAALERAVRSLVPDGTDGLKSRIKRLDGKHTVPIAMIELAHTVRAEGNVAVHEEEWTAGDAQKLIEFARLLFTYIFTLPAEVAAVAVDRGKTAAER